MKRRTAIRRLSLLVGGAAVSFTGIKVFQLYKHSNFQILDENQALLSELAETIIPKTDSPGASEAGVGAFIAKMIRDCTPKSSQNNFIAGLEELAGYSQSKFSRPFMQCSRQERTVVLTHFEEQGRPYAGIMGKIQHHVTGDSFFTTLKKYAVLGYCTSMQGATMALQYDYIPGKYIGTVPMKPGQRAWATQ
jgi:hypothetical protein